MVVREKKGNALSFRCFYHGWSFNVNGRFASRFEEGNYGTEHYGGGCADLAQVPRLESHRDFWFVNFDRNAVSLSDYLAGAKEYIDIVADHAEAGMEIVGSGQQYIINANWKLLAEAFLEVYHARTIHPKTVGPSLDTRGTVITLYDHGHQSMLSPVNVGTRTVARSARESDRNVVRAKTRAIAGLTTIGSSLRSVWHASPRDDHRWLKAGRHASRLACERAKLR